MRETLLSSLDMAARVLQGLGFDEERARSIVERFRVHDEDLIAKQYAVHLDEEQLIQTGAAGTRGAARALRAGQPAADPGPVAGANAPGCGRSQQGGGALRAAAPPPPGLRRAPLSSTRYMNQQLPVAPRSRVAAPSRSHILLAIGVGGTKSVGVDDNLGFYERAELYDIAFSFRDIGGEVDVLTGWYRSMTGRPAPARVLELGAGPAQHARELVRRGAEGWALDMSAAMADYARARAAADGVRLEVVRGDMTAFELPGRFDLVMLMINSVGHLMTESLLVRHLECVARALTPGGIYVMEVAHPADDANHPDGEPPRQWSAQRGQTTVEVSWGRPEDPLDREHRIRTHTVELKANIAGRPVSFVEQVRLRAWKRQAIDDAIQRAGGFSAVRVYGDFSSDVPLEHPEAWRMIDVMSARTRPGVEHLGRRPFWRPSSEPTSRRSRPHALCRPGAGTNLKHWRLAHAPARSHWQLRGTRAHRTRRRRDTRGRVGRAARRGGDRPRRLAGP